MLYIIGHKNPDTDSVVSAFILAKYFNNKDQEASACMAGPANRETEFIFSHFNLDLPKVVTEDELKDKDCFLVDYNDVSQGLVDSKNIVGILDHHLLAGITTDAPIFFRVEPIGSTSSLVYKLMRESKMEPSQLEASLLLSAIISDTLNLKSPTCTDEDRLYYKELVGISKQDPDSLAHEMFEAKSDLSTKSMEEIINLDLKEYNFSDKKVAIAVAETSSLKYFQENEDELINSLAEVKAKSNVDALFFGVVDIINQDTYFYGASPEDDKIIEEVFKVSKTNHCFVLRGVSSRKKEIAPPISAYYN